MNFDVKSERFFVPSFAPSVHHQASGGHLTQDAGGGACGLRTPPNNERTAPRSPCKPRVPMRSAAITTQRLGLPRSENSSSSTNSRNVFQQHKHPIVSSLVVHPIVSFPFFRVDKPALGIFLASCSASFNLSDSRFHALSWLHCADFALNWSSRS